MNIFIAGVGGQGAVLASKLLARCAMRRGEAAHTAETIGMAQRGGCVTSHVRIGECASPLIPKGQADVLLAFEPAEAVRSLEYLTKDGYLIVSTAAVKPVTDILSESGYTADVMLEYLKAVPYRTVFVDGEAIAKECGSQKALNMALLGAAAACGAIGITPELLTETVSEMSPKFREMNRKAIEMGAASAK